MTALAASNDSASWRQSAACLSYDPGLFFPIGKTGRAVTEIQRAKAICAACPVKTECLTFALETHQAYGIWGGCDEDERRTPAPPAAAPADLTARRPVRTGRRPDKLVAEGARKRTGSRHADVVRLRLALGLLHGQLPSDVVIAAMVDLLLRGLNGRDST